MKNRQHKISEYLFSLACIPLTFLAAENYLNKGDQFFIAEVISEDSERKVHDELDESEDNTFGSNPMELLDAWRRATAMDDATAPSDALDEAIKAFEGKELEKPVSYE